MHRNLKQSRVTPSRSPASPFYSQRPLSSSANTFIATTTTLELVLGPCTASADVAAKALSGALIETFNTLTPLRKFVLSSCRKLWVNPQIRALMRSRDRTYGADRAPPQTSPTSVRGGHRSAMPSTALKISM